jgi:signal transduction histidine kinase
MRNPLASIKLALSGLPGSQGLDERERRRVDLVLGEVDRLDGMLSETLDYVRPVKLSDTPVDLDQLIKNAVEASPSGGLISISLAREANCLVLEITNEGEVLSPDTLQRIFEPFYTTKPKGTGLGLGLVKRVVEEHGGAVELTSDTATGTRVVLHLPLGAN